jgi:hypothetical protein
VENGTVLWKTTAWKPDPSFFMVGEAHLDRVIGRDQRSSPTHTKRPKLYITKSLGPSLELGPRLLPNWEIPFVMALLCPDTISSTQFRFPEGQGRRD